MHRYILTFAVQVLLGAMAFVGPTDGALGQDAFNSPIYLSVLPARPTTNDDTLLNYSIPSLGIDVGAKLTTDIEISGTSILFSLNYHPFEMTPGHPILPSYFFPEGTISLGMLAPGNYTITAVLPGMASGSTSFHVVPEPSAMAMSTLGLALIGLPGLRLARRCH